MVLLQMVVQIAIRSVDHPLPEDIPDGTRVGIMTIRGDTVRRHPGYGPCRPKERLSRGEVPGGAEPYVD